MSLAFWLSCIFFGRAGGILSALSVRFFAELHRWMRRGDDDVVLLGCCGLVVFVLGLALALAGPQNTFEKLETEDETREKEGEKGEFYAAAMGFWLLRKGIGRDYR